MPRRCCIPGCKSNYDSELKTSGPVSTFSFPKDEVRKRAWIRAIPRKSWSPTSASAVCANHFDEKDVVLHENYKHPDGTVTKLLLRFPKLSDDAVPCKFPNLPAYLSISTPSARRHPDSRREDIRKRNEQKLEELKKEDIIIEPVIVQEINDEAENTTHADNDFDTEREEVHKRKPEEHLEFSLPKRPCVQTEDQDDPKKLDPAEKKKWRDDCRIFGEHVANKLSMYDSRIQAFVQHQINNILFEADMGRYSHSVTEQWSASPASSPSPEEEEAVLASSPAPHSRKGTSSDLQLALSSSSQPYSEVVKEEEGVTEQHLPHSESLEEEMILELGSPHRSTSHHLDTNTELYRTDNSIYNESYNKAVESHIRTICDVVGKLTGNRPSLQKEDEFDIFGRSVTMQLRTLPFAIALETQLKLQSILTEMRLKTNYCQSESLRNGIPTIVAST